MDLIAHRRTAQAHTRSRRYSDVGEAQAIDLAVQAATYNDFVLPVIYGGRTVAWVFGERAPSRVVHCYRRRPGDPDTLWAGFTGIDDLINETSNNNKFLRMFWSKRNNGALTSGNWQHLAAIGGWPTYETFAGTARTARQFDESSKPAIAHGGNVSTDTKHILMLNGQNTTGPNVYLLYDLVLSYDRCTPTNGSQAMTNVLTAQRYAAAGQPGLRIMGVVTTALAAATNFAALTYATPGGASHTAPNPTDYGMPVGATITGDSYATSAICTNTTTTSKSMLCLMLAAGDSGVASITNYQMSSTPASGEVSFLLGYPLGYFPLQGSEVMTLIDAVKQLPQLSRVYDGGCPTFAQFAQTGSGNQYYGEIAYGWG